MSETQARWQAFVDKVLGRYREILAESDAGFAQFVANPEIDPITFENAMTAIRQRVIDLSSKLETTYGENVAIFGGGEARALHESASRELGEGFDRWEVRWRASLARSLWARVEPLVRRPVACSQCGAELPNRTLFHKPESVTCPYCRAVNSVSPDIQVSRYFDFAPDAFAAEATIETKLALERGYGARRSKAERIDLARRHWRAYVDVRNQVLPMSPEESERYVASKVKFIELYG